jgi:hypothetical protein
MQREWSVGKGALPKSGDYLKFETSGTNDTSSA